MFSGNRKNEREHIKSRPSFFQRLSNDNSENMSDNNDGNHGNDYYSNNNCNNEDELKGKEKQKSESMNTNKSLFTKAKELLRRKSYLQSLEQKLSDQNEVSRESEAKSSHYSLSQRMTIYSNRFTQSSSMKFKPPVPLVSLYSPQVWAFLGRFDEIRGLVTDDRSILEAKFDWLQDDRRIDPDILPPHLPNLVRGALIDGLECQRVTLDQRYLLKVLFSGSTLLHYACCGNQYLIVKFLLESGADPNCLNNGGKEPDFYTSDDAILKLFFHIPERKNRIETKNQINENRDEFNPKPIPPPPSSLSSLPPPPPPPLPPPQKISRLATMKRPLPPRPPEDNENHETDRQSMTSQSIRLHSVRFKPHPPEENSNSSKNVNIPNKPRLPTNSNSSSKTQNKPYPSIQKTSQSSSEVTATTTTTIAPTMPLPPPNDATNGIKQSKQGNSIHKDEMMSESRRSSRKSVQINDEAIYIEPLSEFTETNPLYAQTQSEHKKSSAKINTERLHRSGLQNSFISKINHLSYVTDNLVESAKESLTTAIHSDPNSDKANNRYEAAARKALVTTAEFTSSSSSSLSSSSGRRQSIVRTSEEVEASTLDLLAAIPRPTRKGPTRMSLIKRESYGDTLSDSNSRSLSDIISSITIPEEGNSVRSLSMDPTNQRRTSTNLRNSMAQSLTSPSRRGSVFRSIEDEEEKSKDMGLSNSLNDKDKVVRISKRGSFFQLYESMASLMQSSNSVTNMASSNIKSSETDVTSIASSEKEEIETFVPSLSRATSRQKQYGYHEEDRDQDHDINTDDRKSVMSNIAYMELEWFERLNRKVPSHRVKSRDRFVRSRSVDAVTSSDKRIFMMTNRDMIWRRAVATMKSKAKGEIEVIKDEAMSDGVKMLQKEFKHFADIDKWDGLQVGKTKSKPKVRRQISFRKASLSIK